MNLLLVLALALKAVTGHVDALYIAHQADSIGVPRRVAWGIAWQESNDGVKAIAAAQAGEPYLGPGQVEITWTFDSTTGEYVPHTRRICRELGRYQINPCTYRSRDPRCTIERITYNYKDNVYCGLKKLRDLRRDVCPNWGCVAYRYNGQGPMARGYRERVERYVGHLYLLSL